MKLYAIFHLNINYSSIEVAQRPEVLRRCYEPLLDLIERRRLPLGIEVSGSTLEILERLDAIWIQRLSALIRAGVCELVGSGYAQIIGPLAPFKVNRMNQRIGQRIYQRLLGVAPRIALVNEMAYSAGLIESYVAAGYEGIITEWNNPRKYHPEWPEVWRYYPQIAKGAGQQSIPVIWSDSIAFQKFQRYAHGEISLVEYQEYLCSHVNGQEGYFPIYANDVEIFDMRPGRYATEPLLAVPLEWQRIETLMKRLQNDPNVDLVRPSAVLEGLGKSPQGGNVIGLESPQQPIPVKKQEKYNIYRWALSGRDDLRLNTDAHRLYLSLHSANGHVSETDWKAVLWAYSSDFRTHITARRWRGITRRMTGLLNGRDHCGDSNESQRGRQTGLSGNVSSGIRWKSNGHFLEIETSNIVCVLNRSKGLTIHALTFKSVSQNPLLGTLTHGFYDDIALGADFFSGHTLVEMPGRHKHTDLDRCQPEVEVDDSGTVRLRAAINNRGIVFHKTYDFLPDRECLGLTIQADFPRREPALIRLFNMTFHPNGFDKGSLYFAAHNGGSQKERFSIGNQGIHHARMHSPLISARHGLGATEGVVEVGDGNKKIIFHHNMTFSTLIPSLEYQPLENGRFFLRLQYSAQELDETFVSRFRPFSIRAGLTIDGRVK